LSIYQNPTLSLKRFALPTVKGLDFVETKNIIYCEGASDLTMVYLIDNKKILVNKTLKECEDLLSNSNFYRIHKSFLINLNHIIKYNKGKGGSVILRDAKEPIPVSRECKADFLKLFRAAD
jgi:two-component system LytT family response regulator